MPKREDVHYFGAGPAPMPTEVLEEASRALLNYKDMGIGIAEMSHRSPQANEILAEAKESLQKLLEIPDDYEILFMQGGGSGQFSAIVYHMIAVWVERQRHISEKIWQHNRVSNWDEKSEDEKLQEFKNIVQRSLRCDYLVTGSWSLKASQEAARLIGPDYVHVALDAREHNNGKFGVIPQQDTWKLRRPYVESVGHEVQQSAFTYLCDNETVDGVEFQGFPHVLDPLNPDDDRRVVADMSSNFLSKKVDVKKYAAIFAGAQKNLGTTGVTVLIIRKSLLPPNAHPASPELLRKLGLSVGPVVFDYPTITKNNSLYNTLPIFDVWIASQVMKRTLRLKGSIEGQQKESEEKAQMLYNTLDKWPSVYQVVPEKSVRSRMNLCFRVKKGDADAEKSFLSKAESIGLLGLKGHRSVGGIRISNYNAVRIEGVKMLVQYLNDFAQDNHGANGSV